MKKTILLLLALCISTMMFADNFVMINVKGQQNLKELFNNQDIRIHYYNDDFVLATTKILNDDMVLLDERSFEDNKSYYIVYCEKERQAAYTEMEKDNAEVLFRSDNVLILKPISDKLEPAKNDGMIAVYNKTAKLAQPRRDFPSVTAEDEVVKSLMNQVSTENLEATVQHLQDYGRRQYNSDQAYEASEWLYTQFEDLGLEVEEFPFTDDNGNPSSPNIIATQWGSKYPDRYVVCGSHYDSFRGGHSDKTCPGADDNATGVATVLETARILSQYTFEYSIVYCAFSAEEVGLIGSNAYASFCSEMGMDIVAYFNNDMNGYLQEGTEISIDLVYPESVSTLGDYYMNLADIYFPETQVRHVEFTLGDSDHTSFNNNGYMGIFPFENIDYPNPYIHTAEDIIGTSVTSFEMSQVFSQMNIACVATIANLSTENIAEKEYNHLTVFPNPAKNSLTLTSKVEGNNDVQIINTLGQIVKEFSFDTNTTIDVNDLNNGVYFVKMLGDNSMISKIVVKD